MPPFYVFSNLASKNYMSPPLQKRANNDKVKCRLKAIISSFGGLRVHMIQFPKNSILHDYKVHFIFWQLLLQLLYIDALFCDMNTDTIPWLSGGIEYIFSIERRLQIVFFNLKHCILYLTGRKSHKDVFLYIVATIQNMYICKNVQPRFKFTK